MPDSQKRVSGWADKHKRMGGEGLSTCRNLFWRAPHHRKVNLSRFHQRDQLLTVAHYAQSHVDARMFLVKPRQQLRHEVRGRADDANRQESVFEPFEPRHGVVRFSEIGEQPSGADEEVLPSR